MRRISLALLGATAIGVVTSHGASAADILRKAPPPAPLPAPVQDWSGFYVGVEGGYGWGHSSFNSAVPFRLNNANTKCVDGGLGPNECESGDEFAEFLTRNNQAGDPSPVPISGHNSSGGVVGGFFGAQKQWGSWVLGLEGSIDYADITKSQGFVGSSTISGQVVADGVPQDHFVAKTVSVDGFSTRIDTLGAVNAKIGYAWSPNWLIYGTGGLAFAHVKSTLNFAQSLFHLDCDTGNCDASTGAFVPGEFEGFVRTANEQFSGTAGQSMFGWTAGAGIDYKWQLDPGSAVIFGIDYKHYGFGRHTLSFAGPEGGTFSINASQDVDVIKGRISYLFSIH
jgi:opacity protein-like surface antigen